MPSVLYTSNEVYCILMLDELTISRTTSSSTVGFSITYMKIGGIGGTKSKKNCMGH